MDTIFALATARGRAGVAVVRISGPAAHAAVAQLCTLPPPRQAQLRWLRVNGDAVDQALVLIFPKGQSFTGEESAELHIHGSSAVIARLTLALSQTLGLRMAEAGEFTRRAMDNGKLDLTQVEGLADLIDAESESQRKQALRVLDGAIGRYIEPWRAALIRAAALIEATIDFADEDVPVDVVPEVRELLAGLVADIAHSLHGFGAAERIRDGFEVAIIGPPNIGKSTLLNAIAQRDVAITSEVAGTTRDVIEVRLDVGGHAVTMLDTAGLRDATDKVERIGIDRAIARAEKADIRVFLMENQDDILPVSLQPQDIVLQGKADLRPSAQPSVSGVTGAGIDALLAEIARVLNDRTAAPQVFTRQRHRQALLQAQTALQAAQDSLPFALHQPERVAAELRAALTALEGLLGRIGVEDLLGEIFSSFCIGK